MADLKAKLRNAEVKGKHLRNEGIIPGVLYGKHLSESLNIQIYQKEVEQFLKEYSVGTKLNLVIDGKKSVVLLKGVTRTSGTSKLEHLSFQALTEGEKVTSVAQIVLLNADKADGIVQHILHEISYKALPADITDKVEIDLEGMKINDSISVGDLDFSKNEAIEILGSVDNIIVSIIPQKHLTTEATEVEPQEQADTQTDE
ncbi:MAG: 50S ribosomal protein L25 [Firmicutes bacterium HGW-Firmicutes-21]|nr:MAG: 50S ribosomal protein L25 [Firmicutes bacterium HGW-Firmicutes-21]